MKKTAWIGLMATLLMSSGAYAGDRFVGLGVSTSNIDDSAAFNGTTYSMDDSALGWKIFGGMMVTENFGFEAGWTKIGDMNKNNVDLATDGFMAAGIAALPFYENYSVYAKAGVYLWDQDVNSVNFDGTDLMYGVGAKMRVMDQFFVRVEWEHYDTRLSADLISLSGGVQF